MKPGPIGVYILALLLVFGSAYLLTGALTFSAASARLQDTGGASPMFVAVAAGYVGIIGLAASIGMWLGKKWGWWVGAYYFCYSFARNFHTVLMVSRLSETFEISEDDMKQAYLRYGTRAFGQLLLLAYFFKPNVAEFFDVKILASWKRLLILSLATVGTTSISYLASLHQSSPTDQRPMSAKIVAEQNVTIGHPVVIGGPVPNSQFGAIFEDDGETGYFYGLDYSQSEQPIVDARHIYNVSNVVDKDIPSMVQVTWSADGKKAALIINNYPHAIIDFASRRSYCRTGFPSPDPVWSSHDATWDDKAMDLFR